MSLLIFIVVVLVVLSLAIYAITLLPMIAPPFKQLISVVAIVAALLVICHRAGFL